MEEHGIPSCKWELEIVDKLPFFCIPIFEAMKIGSMRVVGLVSGEDDSSEESSSSEDAGQGRWFILHVWHGVPEIYLPNGWTFPLENVRFLGCEGNFRLRKKKNMA